MSFRPPAERPGLHKRMERRQNSAAGQLRLQSGMTLTEVVMAIALFSASMVILTQSYLTGIHGLRALRHADDETMDLDFVIRQIIQLPTKETLNQGGTYPTLGLGKVQWETKLRPLDLLDSYELQIQMNFSVQGQNQTVERTFHLLRPNWSDPQHEKLFLDQKRSYQQRFEQEYASHAEESSSA